jgi:hypothetical protein
MSHRPSIVSRELSSRTICGYRFIHARVTFTLVSRDLVDGQSGRSIVEVGHGMFWVSSKYNTKMKKCKG